MDIIRLYRDYSIEIAPCEHKHYREGWVNTECPFCSNLAGANPGYHLGWNINEEYFYCWRCGWHAPIKTLSELLHISTYKVREILPEYGINRSFISIPKKEKERFKFPSNTGALSAPYRNYLNRRGFDARKIEKFWKLKATSPVSKLDEIDYRFRIIIPFYWNGQIVSFDSRDITEKQSAKYQACPKNREIIEHKKILYGNQEYWTSTGVCVEGPTDVWKLGAQAFATSGISYTYAQVKVIASTFKKVIVLFDDESQAQTQAKKLVAELKFRGVDAINHKIKGDPGGLRQHEADELIKNIMK